MLGFQILRARDFSVNRQGMPNVYIIGIQRIIKEVRKIKKFFCNFMEKVS